MEGATHKAQQLKQADNLRPIILFLVDIDIIIEQWAPERLVYETKELQNFILHCKLFLSK